VRPNSYIDREQGWKIHVSSSIHCAAEVLDRVIPILIEMNAWFKYTNTISFLGYLNNGSGGITQVGKFITIYPKNDFHFKKLVERISTVTTGLTGPKIISDAQYKTDSIGRCCKFFEGMIFVKVG
jgi:hypothetical protein